MWDLKYDQAVPPLPLPVGGEISLGCATGAEHALPLGCWLLHLEPRLGDDDERNRSWWLYYRGTLRVSPATDLDPKAAGVLVSGDLYLKRQVWHESEGHADAPPPVRTYWPPIFKRDEYRFYVRVTRLAQRADGMLDVELDTYRLDPATGEWSSFGLLTGAIGPVPPKKTWKVRFLSGVLKNDRGTEVATLSLGWICEPLRRAVVEVDHTPERKLPLKAPGRTLKSIFAEVGWDLEIDRQHDVVPEDLPKGYWEDAQLHAQMLKSRTQAKFDTEWRYHIFVASRLWKHLHFAFGKMYDEGVIDSNFVPREGLALAGASLFPDSPMYGSARNQRLEDVPEAFLRTAVHELGHAMGLAHTYNGREFMQSTDYIAEHPEGVFPDNILWRFSREDVVRLKHLPDPWVRPGGLPLEHRHTRLPVPLEDITSDAADQFTFEVTPLAKSVPLGAPVRLHLRLKNHSVDERPGPKSISLSGGCVAGEVIGPAGVTQTFASAKLLEGEGPATKKSQDVMEDDLVLVRGPRGSLFATPGFYEIAVQVVWIAPGGLARRTAKTAVLVTWPPVEDHGAALAVLTSAEIVVPLIFRSDPQTMAPPDRARLDQGIAALQGALASPVLRPHWAAIEARRRAAIKPLDLDGVAAQLQDRIELSAAEVDDLLEILEEAPLVAPVSPAVGRMLDVLAATVADLTHRGLCPDATAKRLAALPATAGKATSTS